MTEQYDPDQQRLEEQLHSFKTLLARFQHIPKEVQALAKKAESDPDGEATSKLLEQVWQDGFGDNVKKITSYTQQAIALHEEFQSILNLVQPNSANDALSLSEPMNQYIPNDFALDNQARSDELEPSIQPQQTDAASHVSPVPKRKKAKHFV